MTEMGPTADCRLSVGMNSKRRGSTVLSDSFEAHFTDDPSLAISSTAVWIEIATAFGSRDVAAEAKSKEILPFKKSIAFEHKRNAASSIDLPYNHHCPRDFR